MTTLKITATMTLIADDAHPDLTLQDRSSISFEEPQYAVLWGRPHAPMIHGVWEPVMHSKGQISNDPTGIELIDTGADIRFSPFTDVWYKSWGAFKGAGQADYGTVVALEDQEWLHNRDVKRHPAVTGKGTFPTLDPSYAFVVYFTGDLEVLASDARIAVDGSVVSFSSPNTALVRRSLRMPLGVKALHVVMLANGRAHAMIDTATVFINFDLTKKGLSIDGNLFAVDIWENDEYNVHIDKVVRGLAA